MPKDQSREKKPRHFTCSKCLKPSRRSIEKEGAVPQTIAFSTSEGLDKHLKAQHKTTMYSCTAVGCLKGTSAPKFQKSETLTQHIKESHKPDTLYTCPVEACSFEPSKLDDLVIHTHWMHTYEPTEQYNRTNFQDGCKKVVSFINAATWKYFRCPIWDCRKFVSGGHEKVSAHLLAHCQIQLEGVQDELANDGYEIQFVSDVIGLSTGHPDTSSVQIKCPACGVLSEDDTKFRHHLETSHMLAKSPGMREHFDTWRKGIMSGCRGCLISEVSRCPCWVLWESYPIGFYRYNILDRDQECPYSTCSFQGGASKGHPSFLRPAEEIAKDLWLHRAEILRHYPQFITYPMFQEQNPELHSCQSTNQTGRSEDRVSRARSQEA
jgi:hypothetical protein